MNACPRATIVIGFTPLERAGLALMLADHGIALVGVYDTFVELAAAPVFDTLVIDLAGFPPEDRHAVERLAAGVAETRRERPLAHILGVQKRFSHTIAALHRAGIDASVDLDADTSALIAAIAGPAPVRADWPPQPERLEIGETERSVLELVAGGCTSRGIATLLGITIHAVESHKQRLFRRLDAQNQAQAVAIAMRLGLIDPTLVRGAAS